MLMNPETRCHCYVIVPQTDIHRLMCGFSVFTIKILARFCGRNLQFF